MEHKDYIELIVPIYKELDALNEKVDGIIKAVGLKEKEEVKEEPKPDATE